MRGKLCVERGRRRTVVDLDITNSFASTRTSQTKQKLSATWKSWNWKVSN